MTQLYVVQTGRTTWEADERFDSAAGAPLSRDGQEYIQALARKMAGHVTSAIYAGNGEAERQTARLLGQALRLKVRTKQDLCEIDYGLWQGLTAKEVKRRQPKLYRQWTEAPGSVRPPGGETLDEAQQRLRRAVKEILKHHKDKAAAVVLRPVVLGLLRCMLRNDQIEALWSHVDPAFTWACYEMDGKSL